MGNELLNLNIDNINNTILLGSTKTINLTIDNLNTNTRLYNVSLYLYLKDGLTLNSSTIANTSRVIKTDGSSDNVWISLKDLAPNEINYNFAITVKSNTKFKNGTDIPFGYLFSDIEVKCIADTMPRGDKDIGNIKIISSKLISFQTTRFDLTVTSQSKMLKGAGTSLILTDYVRVYPVTFKITNNSRESQNVNFYTLLPNGIRFINVLSVTGTDASSLRTQTVSKVIIENKTFTKIDFGNFNLSINGVTTIIINVAIWNRYDDNEGELINHGTILNVISYLKSDIETVSRSLNVKAMDIIVTNSVSKTLADILDNLTFTISYTVGQYYDMKNLEINNFMPDGVFYTRSSIAPFSSVDDSIKKGFVTIFKIPLAIKNSQNNIYVYGRVDSYYRYIYDEDLNKASVVSFDSFNSRVSLYSEKLIDSTVATDSAGSSFSITTPTIKKEFLSAYYSDGSKKTIKTLAPFDFAEYRLTYDSSILKASSKDVFLDDFFPLSVSPIDNIIYDIYGINLLQSQIKEIDPHGVDFAFGNVSGKSYITITFKSQISLLGTIYDNNNLLKLKGKNTLGYSYSNRAQVLVNIGTPNITLTKTVLGPNVTAIRFSEIYTYTVTISNTNTLGTETDAFDFELIDNLSSWFTLDKSSVKITGTGEYSIVAVTDTNITLNINKLSVGQTLKLTYSVKLLDNIPPGLTLALSATTTNSYSQNYDPIKDNFRYTNGVKTATATIASKAISFTKSNTADTFKVGSTIYYKIALTVPLGTIAYSLYVKDTLPSGVQTYANYATRNSLPIVPSISQNVITFPSEGDVDCRNEEKTVQYIIGVKITNATKTIGSITSSQTNTCQLLYKQRVAASNSTITKTLLVTINHPNLVLDLTGNDKSGQKISKSELSIGINGEVYFRLSFLNNSNITLINGIIEIPIDSNLNFISINSQSFCSSQFDILSKKIIVNIPYISSGNFGFIDFTLSTKSNLRSGYNLSVVANAISYFNDISSKVYGGEKSNIITLKLEPGVSLLPNLSDRLNDSTSFKITNKGEYAYILNHFKNIGGGYDDFSVSIQKTLIPYTLFIDGYEIATVNQNTNYYAELDIMKNIAPNGTREILIKALVPVDSSLGNRFDFLVTVTSKSNPYPSKTVLNIDPS